ncbi:transmembrane protease serine 9-like [Drosophila ficusphila]|uniref:transmembrane protease serine 9-like n=1 Tax=Drosophila ficusphila TaxID=30025 RepID=UPI001C8ABA9F|nr:transmembrane protease serine 9-like [Drosophila ficusphila]
MEILSIVKLFLLLLLPFLGSSQFLDPACGIRAQTFSTRVKNGTIAKPYSSPWMVFLKATDETFVCGGTLITNRLVLTAAHCFQSKKQLYARLGEYIRSRPNGCTNNHCQFRSTHLVDAGFQHRLYNPKTHANDIAILRLAKPVVYRDDIRPICIVWDTKWRQYINNIQMLTATGWGITESGLDSDELRTLDIRRQPPGVCTQFIGSVLESNQFCAGNWLSNLCNGDSGGPIGALVPYKNKHRFIQIGIASLTNQRCQKASVFTDIMSHIDFILRVYKQFGNGQKSPVPKTTVKPPTIKTTTKQPTTTTTRTTTKRTTTTRRPVVEFEPSFEDDYSWDSGEYSDEYLYPSYFPVQYPNQFPVYFF